jgi:membrane protease YdiL (CAAX protease family)
VFFGYLVANATSLEVLSRTTAPQSIASLFAAVAFDCVLLSGAFWHYKLAAPPAGGLVNGFGFYRIRGWRLLIALGALVVAIVVAWWGFIAPRWALGLLPLEQTIASADPVAQVGWFAVVALLTPIAEEVFFRGWLWTSLRRFWAPFIVMTVTGIGWLVPHMLGGVNLALRLLPLAVILSLARLFCGSVSATIGLHVLNNACVFLAILLYRENG